MNESLTNDRELEAAEELTEETPQEGLREAEEDAGEEVMTDEASAEALDRLIESVREQTRAEVYSAIRQRGTRPFAIPMNSASVGADFHQMPDSALRAIDERLKRGEKVYL